MIKNKLFYWMDKQKVSISEISKDTGPVSYTHLYLISFSFLTISILTDFVTCE